MMCRWCLRCWSLSVTFGRLIEKMNRFIIRVTFFVVHSFALWEIDRGFCQLSIYRIWQSTIFECLGVFIGIGFLRVILCMAIHARRRRGGERRRGEEKRTCEEKVQLRRIQEGKCFQSLINTFLMTSTREVLSASCCAVFRVKVGQRHYSSMQLSFFSER